LFSLMIFGRNRQKGIALFELVIVISIIVVLVTISIPVWRSIQPTMNLDMSVRSLVSDLRYAQQLAVAEQIVHGVRFDFVGNGYQIIKYGATEEIIKTESLPAGITLEEINGFGEAQFVPYGSVEESGEVRLVNTQNKIKIIDIRPSGFVRISDL